MSISSWGGFIAGVAFLIFVGFTIPVLIYIFKTMKTMNQFLDEVRQEFVPLVNGLKNSVDEVNAELEKVRNVVNAAESIVSDVQVTVKTVQESFTMVSSKLSGIFSVILSLIRGILKRKEEKRKEGT